MMIKVTVNLPNWRLQVKDGKDILKGITDSFKDADEININIPDGSFLGRTEAEDARIELERARMSHYIHRDEARKTCKKQVAIAIVVSVIGSLLTIKLSGLL